MQQDMHGNIACHGKGQCMPAFRPSRTSLETLQAVLEFNVDTLIF